MASSQATTVATSAAAEPTTTAAGTGAPASGPKDIPLINPRTVIAATDTELSYDTSVDIQTAAKFYEDQMPRHGWVAQGQPYVTSKLAKLSFNSSAGDRIVTIGITPDPVNGQTMVYALVE